MDELKPEVLTDAEQIQVLRLQRQGLKLQQDMFRIDSEARAVSDQFTNLMKQLTESHKIDPEKFVFNADILQFVPKG